MLDEIPSDTGSITSEAPSEDEIDAVDTDELNPLQEDLPENRPDSPLPTNGGSLDYDIDSDAPVMHQWTSNSVHANTPHPFEQASGPNNIPEEAESPTDIFFCLFTKELIEKIVFETNLYATQGTNNRFIPTTFNEIKCFLGINLMMGLTKKPSYKDYWSSKMQMRDPFISSVMSRDRFNWLLGHIHINDNSIQPKKHEHGYDKLYKIRPVLEALSHTFSNCYKPQENQTVDESMVKFKGRISFRQYLPMKPIKRGYKIWIRANQSAFVSQFQVYTGKIDTVERNLGSRVVKDLTRPLIGNYHRVFFDNYFNDVQLQKDLLRDNIYACGTIRKGRKLEPKDLKDDKVMKRGDADWRITKGGIFYLKWMDSKSVRFLSNFHNPDDVTTISRKQKDGTTKEFPCLQLVKDYNEHMNYVDKSDMHIATYRIDRKSRKWWHRLFWHFLDLTIVNAYIIFKNRSPDCKSITLKEYRFAVACGLIGADPETPQRGRRSSSPPKNKFKVIVPSEIRYDKVAHLPVHGQKVRCARCSTRSKPHRTRWICSTCQVGLCLSDKSNCFYAFHKK